MIDLIFLAIGAIIIATTPATTRAILPLLDRQEEMPSWYRSAQRVAIPACLVVFGLLVSLDSIQRLV